MTNVEEICKLAKDNCLYVQKLSEEKRNEILEIIADSIVKNSDYILQQNKLDLLANPNLQSHLVDRLLLTKERIESIALGLKKLVSLPCPVGEIIEKTTLNNGLELKKVRVPFGVVAIIYEARPNVTIDVIGLCIKSGNCVVLRGSRDAMHSNKAFVDVLKASLREHDILVDFIQLVADETHEGANQLMNCREYVDVLIPRGSQKLIQTVIDNSTVPVIETGSGNCHAYVEKSADFDMAINIILNGKLTRPSVCNALESVLVDRSIAEKFLPKLVDELIKKDVKIVGCSETVAICGGKVALATDDDFYREFLELKISIKVVDDCFAAIKHINKYSTKHSEVIITNDKKASDMFLDEIDSAVVYVNASTRFTDGFEFGFGAEMGISTQKMHARGPLGLKQLTSEKYQIIGSGQIRK